MVVGEQLLESDRQEINIVIALGLMDNMFMENTISMKRTKCQLPIMSIIHKI